MEMILCEIIARVHSAKAHAPQQEIPLLKSLHAQTLVREYLFNKSSDSFQRKMAAQLVAMFALYSGKASVAVDVVAYGLQFDENEDEDDEGEGEADEVVHGFWEVCDQSLR